MRSVAKLLGILILIAFAPANAQVQPGAMKMSPAPPALAAPQKFVFPGGVALHVKNDEMTDRRTCTIATPMHGIYLEFYGKAGASIWTSDALKLDYSVKPIMRIGTEEPFELDTNRHPHPMFVPASRTAALVKALYSGAVVRIRFVVWPSGDTPTIEIEQGDFAAAYDRGAQICGWPRPSLRRLPPSVEPSIYHGDRGMLDASFGGTSSIGWSVSYFPEYGSCDLRGPVGVSAIAMFHGIDSSHGHDGDPYYPELGTVRFFSAQGGLVSVVESRRGMAKPVSSLLDAAVAAGDDGMIEVRGQLFSLFGLRLAATYAEKTCGVSFR